MRKEHGKRNGFLIKCILGVLFLNAQEQNHLKQTQSNSPVGFTIHDLKDYSRSYLPQVSDYRPIQVSIWYPASGVKRSMRYRDYFRIWNSSSVAVIDSQHYSKNFKEWTQGLGRSVGKSIAPDSLIAIVSNQPVRAGWNAKPAKGHYPVIISHGGGGDALSQAIRNEFLASQGYIVVALPLLHHSVVDFNRGSNNISSMLSMAQDIGFVVNYCRSLPNADVNRIGFTGMHLQTGLTYQTLSRKLAAVVVYEDDMTPLARQPYYDPKSITIPILAVGSEEQRPDFSLLDSLPYAERFVLQFPGLRHIDHYQNEKIEKLQKPGSGKNYDTLNFFIGQFFDYTLKQKSEAAAFLEERSKPPIARNGSIHLVRRTKSEAFPTESDFLAMIRYGKLQQAKTVFETAKLSGIHKSLFSKERFSNLMLYERFHKNTDELFAMTTMLLDAHPSATVAERFLSGIGYAYLSQKKLEQAVGAFKLGVQHFPHSPNAYDGLADGYFAAGDKENAKVYARQTLALLPSAELNAETKQRIEQSAKRKLE